jgi:hypothetical protein
MTSVTRRGQLSPVKLDAVQSTARSVVAPARQLPRTSAAHEASLSASGVSQSSFGRLRRPPSRYSPSARPSRSPPPPSLERVTGTGSFRPSDPRPSLKTVSARLPRAMTSSAAEVLAGGAEGPRTCSVLCDPPVEFASLADYTAHRALVHGPIYEIVVGGRDGPCLQIHRTSRGYICPRGHGPFPIQEKFCSHIRRCTPRPVDLQPGTLDVSWTLISGTIPVVKAPGAPTGRTKSGRTLRAPAAFSQQPTADVPIEQPSRDYGLAKSARQPPPRAFTRCLKRRRVARRRRSGR